MFKFKKSRIMIGFMFVLVLVLGACSPSPKIENSTKGNTVEVEADPDLQQEVEKTYAPRIIKHLKGELQLNQVPQKIVVLDTQYLDQLVALGELPAGSVIVTAGDTDFPSYLADKLVDVEVLGSMDEVNLEAIIALEPDLIICTEFQEKVFESLEKIAPIIMLDRNKNWREVLLTFGEIVDKEQNAQEVIDKYEHKIKQLKIDLAEKVSNQSVALIRPRDNNIRLHTTSHRTAELLYADLGLTPPTLAIDDKETSSTISLEIMPELEADHIFLLTDTTTKELTEGIQSSSIWKNLKAVKENHVYTVDTTKWISYYGPIAIDLIVDEIGDSLQ